MAYKERTPRSAQGGRMEEDLFAQGLQDHEVPRAAHGEDGSRL